MSRGHSPGLKAAGFTLAGDASSWGGGGRQGSQDVDAAGDLNLLINHTIRISPQRTILMYHHKVLIRFSCLLLAALASPALAKEDCPLQPGQREYITFRWESSGHVIHAGVGILDQVEKQGNLNLSECTITPRTSNPKILGNRNWYLYKCGNHQLVRLETYIRCEESMNQVHNRLAGNAFGQSLNQAVSSFVCSMNPVVPNVSWFFRDTKGIDFPLSENDRLLGSFKKDNLRCSTNNKLEASSKVYEVGGVNSRSDSKYIVVIQRTDIYRFIHIPERVPSL